MVVILTFAVFGLGFWLFLMRGEVAYLRRRLGELEDSLPLRSVAAVEPEPVPEPAREVVEPVKVAAKSTPRRVASVVQTKIEPPIPSPPLPVDEPADEAEHSFLNPPVGASFEDLVGGKLPIWIGGIALVFAGFFLVRYTIEAGLLGPGARSILATVFALLLIALSDFGGKLPKLGDAFTADPRVGQSLAGAGVATLYGTLYMASEIYGLIGVMTAFLLVIITTAIAFALSLRHGPPTALMGLAGGFAAPWVAGMGASNLPTLLLYLAVFIAALFGLAVWRRWLWLLVLASGGGAIWSFAMLLTAESGLPFLGLFILATGAGALLALDRFGESSSRWRDLARYAPMALAMVQLAILLPLMEFTLTAWLFYAVLSALTIILAWRDPWMVILVLGALVLSIMPLSAAWEAQGATATGIAAAFGVTLLFGGAGHWGLRKQPESATLWAVAALGAPMLAWFAASLGSQSALDDRVWGMTALAVAAVSAWLAWDRHRLGQPGTVQRLATAATVLMLLMAGLLLIADGWMPLWCAIVALGTAAWAKQTGDWVVRGITIAPLGIAIVWATAASYPLLNALGLALEGDSSAFTLLPDISEAVRATLIPALLILALLWDRWFLVGNKTRKAILAAGGAGVAGVIWMLAKQPAAIQSPSDFIRLGFAERAIFTQLLFAGGWLALSQSAKKPAWPSLRSVGWALAGIALFRIIWFDLALLNPVARPQAVGPVPVANLATGHMALTAIWLWLLAKFAHHAQQQGALRIASLGAMILGVLVTVRQAMQGSILSGGYVDTGENYLYSAALLALAIAWLARGMMAGSRLLRLAGLALLTAVTFKVFLIDAAALTGVLRILSFLGLGIALIGIGWAYGRVMGSAKTTTES